MRFRWRPDSFAMWDNRSTQHCAAQDFGTARRRVERVTLLGERPFGPARRRPTRAGQRQHMIGHPPFPTTPAALTPTVLSEALGTPVASFTACTVGADRGMLGDLVLVDPNYEGRPDRPGSWPSSPPNARAAWPRPGAAAPTCESSASTTSWRRPHRCGCRTSTPAGTTRTRPSSSSSKKPSTSTRPSTRSLGIDVDRAELVLVEAARLHATWWEHPRLPTLDWLPRLDGQARRNNLATITRTGWEPLCDLLGDALTPENEISARDLPDRVDDDPDQRVGRLASH